MQIQDKAMLVRLSIGLPGNGRKDKPLTAEVTAQHQLTGNAGRWVKSLYPPEAFAPITEKAGEARTYHYANTLPWMDDGQRILPVTHYTEFTKAMRGFRVKFNDLAENHFLSQLPKWEAMARAMHNGTFRPEDYLSVGKLRDKFSFRVGFDPIPSGDDFRVFITSGDLDAIKADMDARLNQAVRVRAHGWRPSVLGPLRVQRARDIEEPACWFRSATARRGTASIPASAAATTSPPPSRFQRVCSW